ncbi:MAG: hypothetical protein IKE70_03230 [Bacilli bacterium]|nr:hypothetical protein [Bacilli bacterium]
MSYGITSMSQIIDVGTITSGCNSMKTVLQDFEKSGNTVVEAGNICTEKALSIDDKTMQYSLNDLGEEIKNVKEAVTNYLDEVEALAQKIYQEQLQEYNDYIKKKQEENKKNTV